MAEKQTSAALLLRILVPIVALQAIVWSLVAYVEYSHRQLPVVAEVKGQKLAAFDHRLIDNNAWQSVELPIKSCAIACKDGYRPYVAFRHTFTSAEIPAQDWAVYLTNYRSSAAVYVNDVLVAELGTLIAPIADREFHPDLVSIPRSALVAGENTIDIIVAENIRGVGRLHAFYVGPRAQLKPAWLWSDIINVRSQAWATAIFAMIILLSLGVQFYDRNDYTFAWFAALVFCCALRSQQTIFVEAIESPIFKFMWFYVATFGVFATAVGFTSLLAGRKLGRFEYGTMLALLGGTIATVIVLELDHRDGIFVGNRVLRVAMLAVTPIVLWRLVQALRGRWNASRAWVYAIFAVTAALGIHDVLRSWSPQSLNIQYSNVGLTFLVFAFCIELGRRYQRLLGQVAESDVLREQNLIDERQRIMRDVHDGVGGKLAGLLLSARADERASPELRQGLQDSLQDLRLIIDSLDEVVADDPAIAFGMFRDRVTPWLSQHGIELQWDTNIPSIRGFGSERTLQIYRILQEACNNVVRHAQATKLEVTARLNYDTASIDILIADNGVGLAADYRSGRGLANIRQRIKSLGGALQLVSDGDGLRIGLSIPVALPISAAAKQVALAAR